LNYVELVVIVVLEARGGRNAQMVSERVKC